MPSQRLNQQRLETYLASASFPSGDVAAHLDASQSGRRSPGASHNNGTSTPRDLSTRLKLLELYTLHVLPQNNEWDYAREFITMSEVLDEERREAFLQALDMLKEEKNHDAVREAELKRRQEQELESRRQEEERRRREDARLEEQRAKQASEGRQAREVATSSSSASGKGNGSATSKTSQASGQGARSSQPPSTRPPKSNKTPKSPPPGLYRRTASLLATLQTSILNARQSILKNPLGMLRFVLFFFAFAMAFARRDVRERLKRLLDDVYNKVRRTVGMGVKVSYI